MTWDSQRRELYQKYRSMMHDPRPHDNYHESNRYAPIDPRNERPSSPLREPNPERLYTHPEPKPPISEPRPDWGERLELANEKIEKEAEIRSREIALDSEIDRRVREKVAELEEFRKSQLERNEQASEQRNESGRRQRSELDYSEGAEGLF